jgi:hypothetical protein
MTMSAIDRHTTRLRQSLRTCAAHSVGPIVALGELLTQLDEGIISPGDFQSIGESLIADTHAQIVRYQSTDCDEASRRALMRREHMVLRILRRVFGAPVVTTFGAEANAAA